MTTSIIIPTLNEETNIKRLLHSLIKQTKPANEILVIDGGSKDKTVQHAKRHATVYHTKPSVAQQRNLGADKASGDLIIFLDADTTVKPNFIDSVLYQHEIFQFDLACPTYIPETSKKSIQLVFAFFNHIFRITQKLIPSGAGMCIIVTKKVFHSSNKFDPTSKFEDMRLIRQIGSTHTYKVLPIPVKFSVRRFQKEGNLKLSLKYVLMGILFSFGLFDLAEKISYPHRTHQETYQ